MSFAQEKVVLAAQLSEAIAIYSWLAMAHSSLRGGLLSEPQSRLAVGGREWRTYTCTRG